MRETSNPVFRSLPKQRGGYAQFGTGAAGAATQYGHQADPYAAPYVDQRAGVARPLTIDDVVTKTGIT
ncbi:MAG: Bax inhibitor-1/YccA family protein, partial [Mycobacterium sp.]